MAYGDFKIFRKVFADKVLRDRSFNIADNPEYDRYKRGFASMVYIFFDKKTSDSSIKN